MNCGFVYQQAKVFTIRLLNISFFFFFAEEKMLHEEVDLRWEELLIWIQDFQFLEKLRPELVVGVSIMIVHPFHIMFHGRNIYNFAILCASRALQHLLELVRAVVRCFRVECSATKLKYGFEMPLPKTQIKVGVNCKFHP